MSTNTDWDVSDDASWLTATETNATTISVNFDANNTSIQRTANITVSATGGLTETVLVVQEPEIIQYPNLTTHKPSGWDDRIIVSPEVGTHQNDSVVDGKPSFIDLAWINNGIGDAGAYTSCLVLDSDTISYFDSPALPGGSIDDIIDRGFTFTGIGWHVLKVVLDVYNDVNESNEDDNEYQKSFYVKSTVNVESLILSENILLYPNPSDGKFTLELQNALGERYSIEIIDPTGKVVWDNQIENQGPRVKESIDLSTSPAGLYFIKVYNKNIHSVKKLILVK